MRCCRRLLNIRLTRHCVERMVYDVTMEEELVKICQGVHYEMGNTILHLRPDRLDVAIAFKKRHNHM